MKKKSTIILFIAIVLLQSCTAYQKSSTPLEEAYDKGVVKVTRANANKEGSYYVSQYEYITKDDSLYYGITGRRKEQILASKSTNVYLKDLKKSKSQTLAIAIPVSTIVVSAVVLLIACNCPHVDIIDTNNKPIFQGSLFPGAIFKTLERTDQLVMDYQPKEDKVHVRISNVLPEKEYINEIKLLQYQIKEEERLAIDNSGNLIAVSNLISPNLAIDINKSNRVNEIGTADGLTYNFNDIPQQDQFNRLDLKFHVDDQMDDLNLVIRGKQSEWLEVVGNEFFSLFGNKFNAWTKRMDNVNLDKYNSNASESGFSLRVLAKIGGEFKLIDAFHNAGTKVKRDMVLNLPAGLNYGPELEIRLESVYRFWEIDQVALAKNVRVNIEHTEMNLSSAISNTGVNVIRSISEVDEQYGKILSTGDYIDLNFDYTQPPAEVVTKLVLTGTGYYHHEKEYSNDINKKALRALKQPYATHQFSQIIEQAHMLAKSKQDQ